MFGGEAGTIRLAGVIAVTGPIVGLSGHTALLLRAMRPCVAPLLMEGQSTVILAPRNQVFFSGEIWLKATGWAVGRLGGLG